VRVKDFDFNFDAESLARAVVRERADGINQAAILRFLQRHFAGL